VKWGRHEIKTIRLLMFGANEAKKGFDAGYGQRD